LGILAEYFFIFNSISLACQQCNFKATKVTYESSKKMKFVCVCVYVIEILKQITAVSGWFHCNIPLVRALGKFSVIRLCSVYLDMNFIMWSEN